MQLFDVRLEDIDLSAPEFWRAPRDFRESAFAKLRNEDPYRFYEEMELAIAPKGPGYIALTRHDDIWHVSRNPQLFCSGKGSNIIDLSQELNEFFGSMISMDDPKHFRLRSIVSKGFTPREIARIEEYVKVKARTIIDSVMDKYADKEFDFVDEVAAKFPLQIICEMMGIPEQDERQIFEWTNTILGAGDPDFGGTIERLMEAAIGMFSYAKALGETRLANPTEDLTSVMMHAVVDGERLTSQEFGSFFILLVVAGNETTRNAITHGMLALTENPDQRKIWFENFDLNTKTAVEEIVRWATPVIHFRRTATEDTEINGFKVKSGQKVVLFYNSGNRDERIFANPFKFDVTRAPQPTQIGFGAGGPHFCLGANLARREIAVMFDEIRRRVPNLRITGEPAYLQSSFINGIKRINCHLD
ncbi:MAG: cytochrome P450 [Actinomycetota bacterium]|nr:cytochrome P450 [Actinomycetota bacterium]